MHLEKGILELLQCPIISIMGPLTPREPFPEYRLAAVRATGHGQSEVLTSHCQVMDNMTRTLFGEMATVL